MLRHGWLAAFAGCLGSVVLVSSGWADTAPRTPLQLAFESGDAGSRTAYSTFDNGGSGHLAADVASLHGGVVRRAQAGSQVADLPAYDGTRQAPRAVIRVRNAGSTDELDPQASRFEFGADFWLDERSRGRTRIDNGDNLVQRGLAASSSQFKLQVDRRRPSCRVQGARGHAVAVSPIPVEHSRWYTVRCVRDAGTVTISVSSHGPDGSTSTVTKTASGTIGALSFPHRTPLSVGGKLRPTGALVAASTDQFNGFVDNAFLSIG